MQRRQGSLEGLGERLGFGWPHLRNRNDNLSRVVWFHGASVGEVQMLLPLIEAWKKSYPASDLLLTTMTITGRQTAIRLFPNVRVVLMPLDLPWIWPLFFRHFRPVVLIIAETELWPNLLRYVGRRRVPTALVNARLSLQSFTSYRFFNFFTRSMFLIPDLVIVQDQVSGQRFAELGTSSERIIMSGNMKFDMLSPGEGSAQTLYREFFPDDIAVVVAGSTHAGEEEMLLDVWEKGLQNNPGIFTSACLVIAPRHPQRFNEVAGLLHLRGLDFRVFSGLKEEAGGPVLDEVPRVLLLDTMGDLIHFYNLSRFAIIGGTLVPGVGGHNPLEAAIFAKAVVHGGYVANFRDGFSCLDEQGGGLLAGGQEALENILVHCLQDPEYVLHEGVRAAATVRRQRGAVSRTMASLEQMVSLSREDIV